MDSGEQCIRLKFSGSKDSNWNSIGPPSLRGKWKSPPRTELWQKTDGRGENSWALYFFVPKLLLLPLPVSPEPSPSGSRLLLRKLPTLSLIPAAHKAPERNPSEKGNDWKEQDTLRRRAFPGLRCWRREGRVRPGTEWEWQGHRVSSSCIREGRECLELGRGFHDPYFLTWQCLREVLSIADSPALLWIFLETLRNKNHLPPSLPLWSLTSEVRNITNRSALQPRSLREPPVPEEYQAVTSTHLDNIPFLNNPGWEGKRNVSRLLREKLEGGGRTIKVLVPSETGCYTKRAKITKTQGKIETELGGSRPLAVWGKFPPSPGRVTHTITPILHESHFGNRGSTARITVVALPISRGWSGDKIRLTVKCFQNIKISI